MCRADDIRDQPILGARIPSHNDTPEYRQQTSQYKNEVQFFRNTNKNEHTAPNPAKR
jgi:hypothetical protein